jgi:hypothetical protein
MKLKIELTYQVITPLDGMIIIKQLVNKTKMNEIFEGLL